ncbi:MAG TPA: thymidylate synthase [Candidatus Paceibacterota bacterium]|nr:thymidylate synthase [Candidatus Paceibacterota bacterium]
MERTTDSQYEDLLREILENGKTKAPIHTLLPENKNSGSIYALELSGKSLTYSVANGAPITPIRNLDDPKLRLWLGAIGEIVGFINGARTLKELMSYGCPEVFWKNWVTKEKCAKFGLEEGDLGPGSYGPILTAFPTADGKTFNQVKAVVTQMQKMPYARTQTITTWYPPYALGDDEQGFPRKVVVAPCHGNFIIFNIFDGGEMHMVHDQRSADGPVGLVLNLTEWFAFGMMVAYMTGLNFTQYTHQLPNPQIYDIQIEKVKELLEREPRRLPSLYLHPKREIKSIFDFRTEDFELEDYDPHPKMKIPTLI